jgi:hypothetical protein
MNTRRIFLGLALAAVLALPALAQQPAAPPLRIRGEITKVEGAMVTVHTRSGDWVTVKLADNVAITGVKKAEFSEVAAGKFVGIASRPQPDGSLKALEVLVFPEAARGSNEGHYPWDLAPDSMMTNANISAAVESKNGRELTLTPKGSNVKIIVPEGVPVVTFAPADKSKIAVGAHVVVVGNKQADGSIVAPRVLVGLDVVPPM